MARHAGASGPSPSDRPANSGSRNPLARLWASFLAKPWALILLVVSVIFLALLEDVLEGDMMRLDVMAHRIVVEGMRADWLTPIMETISELATPVVLVAMLLVVAAFAPGRRPGRCAALNLVLVTLLNLLLKQVVQRPRPDGFRLVAEMGYSFPSGHSMVAMGFYGLLLWMVWHYERDSAKRWPCCVGFALLIVAVGFSRIYLGVHYASDVLAGFCVSIAWLVFYTRVVAPLLMPEDAEPPSAEGPAKGHSDERGA